MANFFTDKFFESPLYKTLQAPYNERMAREAAANNPLAPSQGGPWPDNRPRSTALTPTNYRPTVVPQDPNDPRRATADMRVPGLPPYPSSMPPFPLAYPDNAPIDITVRGGNVASVPMPQKRPNLNIQPFPNQGNVMDPGNEGYVDPVSAYAPPPQTPAAVAAINGLSPLSASERIKQPVPGAPTQMPNLTPAQQYDAANLLAAETAKARAATMQGLYGSRDTSAAAYDAANAAGAERARTQDRSGVGTDGYIRDASGQVIGRDAKYQGLTPEQMYNTISGRPQDDSWKTIGSSASSKHKWGADSVSDPSKISRFVAGGPTAAPAPVTLGPMQRPASMPRPKLPNITRQGRR